MQFTRGQGMGNDIKGIIRHPGHHFFLFNRKYIQLLCSSLFCNLFSHISSLSPFSACSLASIPDAPPQQIKHITLTIKNRVSSSSALNMSLILPISTNLRHLDSSVLFLSFMNPSNTLKSITTFFTACLCLA